MAKLYASEAAQEVAAGAMRIAGPASQRAELGSSATTATRRS